MGSIQQNPIPKLLLDCKLQFDFKEEHRHCDYLETTLKMFCEKLKEFTKRIELLLRFFEKLILHSSRFLN